MIVAIGAVGFVSPAEASTTASSATAQCQFPKASDDDTISILGRICDRRDTPQTPVEGVTITVENEAAT